MATRRCLGYKKENYAQPQHPQEKKFIPAPKRNPFLYGNGGVHRPAVCAWDFVAGQSRELFHALNRRLRINLALIQICGRNSCRPPTIGIEKFTAELLP
jgi:hypothetical protein